MTLLRITFRRFTLPFLLLALTPAAFAKALPIQMIAPRDLIQKSSGPTSFQWQLLPTSAGVDRYELTLYTYGGAGIPAKIIGRTSASAKADSSTELGGGFPSGNYAWKIEAKDKQGTTVGSSQVRFKIIADVYRKKGSLIASAGLALIDYSYASVFPGPPLLTGTVPASLFGYLFALEYRISEKWSTRLDYRYSSLKFAEARLGFSGLDISGEYRAPLDSEEIWHYTAGLQIASTTIPQLTPKVDQSFTLSKVSRKLVMPTVGVDYELAENAAAFTRTGLGLGLSLDNSAGPVTAVKKGTSFHFSVGLRGLLFAPWGFELETTYVRDSYGYTGSSGALETELRGYIVHFILTRTF